MKIYDLSGHAESPCFLLKHAGVTLMLDCHLDTSNLHRFLPVSTMEDFSIKGKSPSENIKVIEGVDFIDAPPEFIVPQTEQVDISQVDAIILTTQESLLALPFITEYSSFHGAIYATEPILTFGKLLMEELVANVSRVRKDKATSPPSPLSTTKNQLRIVLEGEDRLWKGCYNQYDITSCVAKVTTVAFNQVKEISCGLKIKASSSGHSIGSCNWLVYSHYHKISYIASSSALSTHTMPMAKSDLKGCDVMLMSGLTQNLLNNPDNYMREFCLNTSMTLKKKGRVLVPCAMVGVLFDLIDCLFSHLDSSSLLSTPVYIISPIAKSSLAFANIYAEWLSSHKQCKVYQPEAPFVHAELIKSNRLEVFSSISEGFSKAVKHPCVVFCSDQLLRYGDAVDLMLQWKGNGNNSVIFTKPTLNCLEVLGPYLPMKMKVFHCPIDTRLSTSQANKLITDLQPRHLILPAHFINSANPDVSVSMDLNPLPLAPGGMQRVSLKRTFQKVTIAPELAESLEVKRSRRDCGVCVVSGLFSGKDYKYELKAFKGTQKSTQANKTEGRIAFQPPNLSKLLQGLAERGIEAVLKEEEDGRVLIAMEKEGALIELLSHSTNISFNIAQKTSTPEAPARNNRKVHELIKSSVFAAIPE